MSENKQMLGTFIAKRRKELGITQNQLAGKLGVTGKAVSKWETLDANPDVGLLLPLASVLQVSADELLRGESDPPLPDAESADSGIPDSGIKDSEIFDSYTAAPGQPAPGSIAPANPGIARRILLPIAGTILALPALAFLLSFLITLIEDAEALDVTPSELTMVTVFSALFFGVFAALSTLCFVNTPGRPLPAGFVRYRALPKEERIALKKQFGREYRGLRIACLILFFSTIAVLFGSCLLMLFHPGALERLLYGIGIAGTIISYTLTLILIKKRQAWFATQKTQI